MSKPIDKLTSKRNERQQTGPLAKKPCNCGSNQKLVK